MLDRLLPFLAKLSRRSDLVIAVLMLVAVTMMLIPLPTWLVDILITANIALSVLILLAALYVTHPLQFSSLPSVILIATLFRLAITITTTRLILLQADAGEIVTAFGSFVVGGSIAVGLVIFLIITTAQFVVIAKGAERVAEVAARFTLDALPGKQMSIDAELRNGDIDQAEARHLRRQLEHESQLYGAMDGAMKFVKGDVIAGIVIIFVNLIGGFSVGTLQHDMSMGEAMQTYSLLTVGDGLVAQIPALLIAIAAGTMITRVASADDQGDLGQQITSQLLRDGRTLALGAAILIGLSLVPGFPSVVFLVLGGAMAAGAYGLHRSQSRRKPTVDLTPPSSAEQRAHGEQTETLSQDDRPALPLSNRLVVRLGSALGAVISAPDFARESERVRQDLQTDLGIEVPAIRMHVDDTLGSERMRVDMEGAPILTADVPADRVLVLADRANLDLLGIDYRKGAALAGWRAPLWVEAQHASELEEAHLSFIPPLEVVRGALEYALRAYADHFVGIQETRRLLSTQEAEYPELVREVQEAVPLQKIADVLRRLVAENVPVRNLRIVLEALAGWGQREKDAAVLAERVRIALKRQITFRVANRDNIVAAYVLQPSAEEALRAAVQTTPAGAFVNPSSDDVQAIVEQIEQTFSQASADTAPVVLTAVDIRRHLRSLLMQKKIELPVLSYQELAPEFSVQPLATITTRRAHGADRQPRALPATQAPIP